MSAASRRAGLPIALPVLYGFAQLQDREWLRGALAGQCVHDVARAVGCTPHSARYAAHKYGGALAGHRS